MGMPRARLRECEFCRVATRRVTSGDFAMALITYLATPRELND